MALLRACFAVKCRRRLTLPSRGRPTSGFACCRPPLMSNVRALRMLSLARGVIAEPSLSCGTGAFIARLVGAVSRRARLPRSSSASSYLSSISSSASSASSPISSWSLRSLFHGLQRRQLFALRREHRKVSVRLTRALRASVLRRAVRALGRLVAAARKRSVEPSGFARVRVSFVWGVWSPCACARPAP